MRKICGENRGLMSRTRFSSSVNKYLLVTKYFSNRALTIQTIYFEKPTKFEKNLPFSFDIRGKLEKIAKSI